MVVHVVLHVVTSNAPTENASGQLVNAIGKVTALMGATSPLGDVNKTALKVHVHSNATVVNAYLPIKNVTT